MHQPAPPPVKGCCEISVRDGDEIAGGLIRLTNNINASENRILS